MEEILKMLKSDDEGEQIEARQRLININPSYRILFDLNSCKTTKEIEELTTLLLNEQSEELVFQEIDKLKLIALTGENSEKIINCLINLCYDANAEVVRYAREALIQREDISAKLSKHLKENVNFLEEVLISTLSNGSADTKKAAIEELQKIRTDKATTALLNTLLYDKNDDVTLAAAKSLYEINPGTVLQTLNKMLSDSNVQDSDKIAAIAALGKIIPLYTTFDMRHDILVELSMTSLQDNMKTANEYVKSAVVDVLIKIDPKPTLEYLINTLSDSNSEQMLKVSAITSLVKMMLFVKDKLSNSDRNGDVDEEILYSEEILSLDRTIRNEIPQLLIGILYEPTNENNKYLKSVAAKTLGIIIKKEGYTGYDLAINSLSNSLSDTDTNVRVEATKALSEIKPNVVIEHIIHALIFVDENQEAGKAAEEILYYKGEDNVYSNVKIGVLRALEQREPVKAVKYLIAALADLDESVREVAKEILEKIVLEKQEDANDLIEKLIYALDNSSNKHTVIEVLKILDRIDPGIALNHIHKALDNNDMDINVTAQQILLTRYPDQIEKYLILQLSKDLDVKKKRIAIETLGKVKPEMVIQILINKLINDNVDISNMFYFSGYSNCVEVAEKGILVELSKLDPNNVSDLVVRYISTEVLSPNKEIAIEAIKTLQKIAPHKAVEPLLAVASSDDPDIRKMALEALQKIAPGNQEVQLNEFYSLIDSKAEDAFKKGTWEAISEFIKSLGEVVQRQIYSVDKINAVFEIMKKHTEKLEDDMRKIDEVSNPSVQIEDKEHTPDAPLDEPQKLTTELEESEKHPTRGLEKSQKKSTGELDDLW